MSKSKDTSSKRQGKSSVSNDYKYIPRAENSSQKSATDKKSSSDNMKGI